MNFAVQATEGNPIHFRNESGETMLIVRTGIWRFIRGGGGVQNIGGLRVNVPMVLGDGGLYDCYNGSAPPQVHYKLRGPANWWITSQRWLDDIVAVE